MGQKYGLPLVPLARAFRTTETELNRLHADMSLCQGIYIIFNSGMRLTINYLLFYCEAPSNSMGHSISHAKRCVNIRSRYGAHHQFVPELLLAHLPHAILLVTWLLIKCCISLIIAGNFNSIIQYY